MHSLYEADHVWWIHVILKGRSWSCFLFPVCQRKVSVFTLAFRSLMMSERFIWFVWVLLKSQSEFVQLLVLCRLFQVWASFTLHVIITFLHENNQSSFWHQLTNIHLMLQWTTENLNWTWSCSEVRNSNISAALVFIWWGNLWLTKHPQTEKNAKTAFLMNPMWWNMKSSEQQETFRSLVIIRAEASPPAPTVRVSDDPSAELHVRFQLVSLSRFCSQRHFQRKEALKLLSFTWTDSAERTAASKPPTAAG